MKAIFSSMLFISLLISIGHPVSAAGAGAQGIRPPAPARASTTQQPADGGRPRAYVTPSRARLVIYEPQIANWLEQKRMAMYAAASYTPADQSSTGLGIRAEADTKISVPERLVSVSDLTMTSANSPALSRDQLSNVVSEINAAVPREERVIGLDRVLAAFDVSQVKSQKVEDLNTTPPPIVFSTRPAALVNIDGAPIWSPITDNDLLYAVNTNWDLFASGSTPTHYPAYGYGARNNPWTGVYTRGGAVYGSYGGAGYAARYNPRTGTYAGGAAAWGPGGARGAAQAWNPRTGTYAQTRQGAHVFGSGAVGRSGLTGRTTVPTIGGNVFARHDGNIHRNQGGSWQKFSIKSGKGFSGAGSYRPNGGLGGGGRIQAT